MIQTHLKNNPDIRSLVFIARVGSIDDPQSCALLEWNRDLDHIGMFDNSYPDFYPVKETSWR